MFDVDAIVPVKNQKKIVPFIVLALGAADEAIQQSGWTAATNEERKRTAAIIAS